MLVLLQMKVTPELIAELQGILTLLSTLHKREVEDLDKKSRQIPMQKDPLVQKGMVDEFNYKSISFRARAQRITMQNVLRALLSEGLKAYAGKVDQLLLEIDTQGVSRGRPKTNG